MEKVGFFQAGFIYFITQGLKHKNNILKAQYGKMVHAYSQDTNQLANSLYSLHT